MKTKCGIVLIIFFTSACFGQKRVSDLNANHAAALEVFLSGNNAYGFLSENVLDAEYLKEMRKYFKGLKPYYNVGDFNKDGFTDFALILSRSGSRTDNGEGFAETHRYDYPLAIIIFNADRKGKFRKAFIEDIEAPLACFLNTDIVKKKKELYFGVFESDADTRIFAPAGKGYIIEYPDEP